MIPSNFLKIFGTEKSNLQKSLTGGVGNWFVWTHFWIPYAILVLKRGSAPRRRNQMISRPSGRSDKRLTVPKWVQINWPKIPKCPKNCRPNLSAHAQKFGIFQALWVSIVCVISYQTLYWSHATSWNCSIFFFLVFVCFFLYVSLQ